MQNTLVVSIQGFPGVKPKFIAKRLHIFPLGLGGLTRAETFNWEKPIFPPFDGEFSKVARRSKVSYANADADVDAASATDSIRNLLQLDATCAALLNCVSDCEVCAFDAFKSPDARPRACMHSLVEIFKAMPCPFISR